MPSLHSTTPCVFSPFLQRSLFAPAAAFQSARLKRTVSAAARFVCNPRCSVLKPLTARCRAFTRALWHRQYTTMLYIPAIMGLVLYLTQVTASQRRIAFWVQFAAFRLAFDLRRFVCLFVRHIPIGSVGSADAHRYAQVYSMATSHTLDNPFVPIYSIFIAIW
jgi:hypothetical protein